MLTRLTFLPPLLLVLALPAAAQQPRWQTFGGSSLGFFGANARAVPDLTGDGVADVLVGAPSENPNGTDSGSAYLLSGSDGSIRSRFDGDGSDDAFGSAVASAGDTDGDGIGDLVVGADELFTGPGYARIHSGADGSVLHTLTGGPGSRRFGKAVAGVGDVDGDGASDVLVGAPGFGAGEAVLFSGRTGARLRSWSGAGNDRLGSSVAALGDLTGDGVAELALGATQGTTGTGYVRVVDGARGATLATVHGANAGDTFGFAVAGGGDVDGDGVPDLVVGAIQAPNLCNPPGYARVFSGADFSLLHTFAGDGQSDFFGVDVAIGGDANGDGRADVLVGAPESFIDCGFGGRGYVRLFSGATGLRLYELRGDTLGNGITSPIGGNFGTAVDFVPDVDGDGTDEMLVGASGERTGTGLQAGRVDLYPGDDLFLDVSPRVAAAGTRLAMDAGEGIPGQPTITVLRAVNGAPVLLQVGAVGSFGATGHRTVSLVVPQGVAGATAGFQAFALDGAGALVDTAVEVVRLR